METTSREENFTWKCRSIFELQAWRKQRYLVYNERTKVYQPYTSFTVDWKTDSPAELLTLPIRDIRSKTSVNYISKAMRNHPQVNQRKLIKHWEGMWFVSTGQFQRQQW